MIKGYAPKAQSRIEDGLCPLCGEKPENSQRKTCENCREKIGTKQKSRYLTQRIKVFQHYGKECSCCGEKEVEFLAIDHLDGHDNRKGDQRNLTHWIIKNNFPPGFRVLCHNCNMAIRWGRECPHNRNFRAKPV